MDRNRLESIVIAGALAIFDAMVFMLPLNRSALFFVAVILLNAIVITALVMDFNKSVSDKEKQVIHTILPEEADHIGKTTIDPAAVEASYETLKTQAKKSFLHILQHRRSKQIALAAVGIALVTIITAMFFSSAPNTYRKAEKYLAAKDYESAIELYLKHPEYSDSAQKLTLSYMEISCAGYAAHNYEAGYGALANAVQYGHNPEYESRLIPLVYDEAGYLLSFGRYEEAMHMASAACNLMSHAQSEKIKFYKNNLADEISTKALSFYDSQNFTAAMKLLEEIEEFAGDTGLRGQLAGGALSMGLELLDQQDYDKASLMFLVAEDFGLSPMEKISMHSAIGDWLFEETRFEEAIVEYEKITENKGSDSKLNEAYLARADQLIEAGKMREAAICLFKGGDKERSFDIFDFSKLIDAYATLAAIVGADGNVYVSGYKKVGGETEIDSASQRTAQWRNMVSVAVCYQYVIGVDDQNRAIIHRIDGDREDIFWEDIAQISATETNSIVGLKTDGTVCALAPYYSEEIMDEIRTWKDVVQVEAAYNFIAAVKSDGSVLITRDYKGYSDYKNKATNAYLDVEHWTDIVEIDSSFASLVGIKSDGTVVTAGWLSKILKKQDLKNLDDIVSISTYDDNTIIGLKPDGTVAAATPYWKRHVIEEAEKWQNIIAIITGDDFVLGLQDNGDIKIARPKSIQGESIQANLQVYNIFERPEN